MLSAKTYLKVSGAIFFVVGVFHLVRYLTGMPVMFGSFSIPVWVSLVGLVVAGYLSYSAFSLSQKKSSKK